MEVTLPRRMVNALLQQAQQSPEAEVCGLIGAMDNLPRACYPVPNIATAPRRLFQMEPRAQIDALRYMRGRNESLFGIYHSHPHSPATPSATDIVETGYPDALYLIISLNTRGVLEMRAWRLAPQLQEVELRINEDHART